MSYVLLFSCNLFPLLRVLILAGRQGISQLPVFIILTTAEIILAVGCHSPSCLVKSTVVCYHKVSLQRSQLNFIFQRHQSELVFVCLVDGCLLSI